MRIPTHPLAGLLVGGGKQGEGDVAVWFPEGKKVEEPPTNKLLDTPTLCGSMAGGQDKTKRKVKFRSNAIMPTNY